MDFLLLLDCLDLPTLEEHRALLIGEARQRITRRGRVVELVDLARLGSDARVFESLETGGFALGKLDHLAAACGGDQLNPGQQHWKCLHEFPPTRRKNVSKGRCRQQSLE